MAPAELGGQTFSRVDGCQAIDAYHETADGYRWFGGRGKNCRPSDVIDAALTFFLKKVRSQQGKERPLLLGLVFLGGFLDGDKVSHHAKGIINCGLLLVASLFYRGRTKGNHRLAKQVADKET